jgi:uncharacterized protein YueI
LKNSPSLDDYLEKGMYGEKQTKPEERKKFLGTLRERIVVALTKSQVMEKCVYPEVEDFIKSHPNASLYVNGELNYSTISKYIQIAKKNGNSFSIVTNQLSSTNIGLVLAFDYAIDKEDIYISKNKSIQKESSHKKKKGLWSSLKGKLQKKS